MGFVFTLVGIPSEVLSLFYFYCKMKHYQTIFILISIDFHLHFFLVVHYHKLLIILLIYGSEGTGTGFWNKG